MTDKRDKPEDKRSSGSGNSEREGRSKVASDTTPDASSRRSSGAGGRSSSNNQESARNRRDRNTRDDSSRKARSSRRDEKKKKSDKGKEPGWFDRIGSFTSSALSLARRTTDNSVKVGKTILRSQDQIKVMVAAGQSLKDLREVAGLTVNDLGDAINLKDKTFWEAVENGTATISFELILRLAALLARNDPIPFILKYTRTYNPELWRILNDWGLGRLPLHYEREREFINIYRRHDAARHLSDEAFNNVLGFTRKSFEMALHFAVEQEQISGALRKQAKAAGVTVPPTGTAPGSSSGNTEQPTADKSGGKSNTSEQSSSSKASDIPGKE